MQSGNFDASEPGGSFIKEIPYDPYSDPNPPQERGITDQRVIDLIGAHNIAYPNGVQMINPEGIRRFALGIMTGAIPGDPSKAQRMLEWVLRRFPKL